MKKVLSRWSITRGGSRVESIFLDAISTLPITATTDEDRVFIWKKGQFSEAYEGYRTDNSENGKRSMDEIASEEIFNAAIEVLIEQISLSETDLIRETAKKFGFSRMGGVIEGTVGYSIHKNISAGKLVKNDNGSITAAEPDF